MKIKTADLQSLIPILKNVCGNNENKPKTTMLGIKTTADSIVLYTIGRDRVKTSIKVANPDQGIDLAVNANLFLGLLGKTTTDEIELTLNSTTNNIVFKGNGTYNLSKMTSETGDIKFDDIDISNLTTSLGTMTKDFISSIMSNNTFALLKTKDGEPTEGRLSTENYHLKTDRSMTTDSAIISKTNEKSGLSQDISVSPNTMSSLNIIGLDITVYDAGNDLVFKGGDIILSAPKIQDANTFPFEALEENLVDTNFDATITLKKTEVLATIDRLNLFNNDNSPLVITFNNNTVDLSIKTEKETLISTGDGKGFSISLDSTKFVSSVKVINNETITIKFNTTNKEMIKLDDGKVLAVAVSAIQ